MITKKCKRCGEVFSTSKNAQVYCAKCQKENAKRKSKAKPAVKIKEFACGWCGTKFLSARKKKYCCRACQLHACGHTKPKPKKKSTNFMSIEEVARASKEMGISAGEYMAKYCYGKEGV